MARENVKQSYDPDRIAILEQSICNMEANGELHAYEITLDGIPVVQKNDDSGRFREFEDFVNMDRRFKLLIRVFHAPTDCQRFEYTYHPEGDEPEAATGLAGLGSISEQIAVERLRWDHEQLQRRDQEQRGRIEELKDELRRLKQEKGKLEEEAAELRDRKLVMGNINLAELGSVIVEGMIRRNTHLLARHPLTRGLAGIIDADNEEGASAGELNSADGVSEEDEAYLELLRKIQEAFSPQDFMRVLGILDKLIASPVLIGPTEEFLSEQQTTQTESL